MAYESGVQHLLRERETVTYSEQLRTKRETRFQTKIDVRSADYESNVEGAPKTYSGQSN